MRKLRAIAVAVALAPGLGLATERTDAMLGYMGVALQHEALQSTACGSYMRGSDRMDYVEAVQEVRALMTPEERERLSGLLASVEHMQQVSAAMDNTKKSLLNLSAQHSLPYACGVLFGILLEQRRVAEKAFRALK